MDNNIYICLKNIRSRNDCYETFTKDKEYPFVGMGIHPECNNCMIFINDQGITHYIASSFHKYFVKKSEMLSDEVISELLNQTILC